MNTGHDVGHGKIKIGVIGLGVGRSHIKACLDIPQAELAGVCDTWRERLDSVAKEFKAPFKTTDYRELLKMEGLRAVVVAAPDHCHVEQCIAAMKAGKDVLCEKPLALSLKDCRRLIEVSRQTGRKLMVGQVCRFTPAFQLARKLVARGEIGELFFAESEYAHDYKGHVEGVDQWRKSRTIKREPFLGGGCHAVDLLRWIVGEPEEVFAYANHKCLKDWPVDDCTLAVFRFKNGATGKVFVSIGCKRPYTMRTCFYGTKGTIICDNTSPAITVYRQTRNKNGKEDIKTQTIPVPINSENMRKEMDVFVNALRKGMPVPTDAREGAGTVAACLAAVKSAQCGRPMRIPKV